MRRLIAHTVTIALLCSLTACGDNTAEPVPFERPANSGPVNSGSVNSDPARPSDASCIEGHSDEELIREIYDATDDSIHELITCSGVQARVQQNMLIFILMSNKDFFDDATRERLVELADDINLDLEQPFTRTEDGIWGMALQGGLDGDFTVQFFEPDGETLVLEDPFDIASYFEGLVVEGEMTFDEMIDNYTVPNTFTYTYTGPGALGHLLNDGEPLPEEGFEIEISLLEMAAIALIGPDAIEGGLMKLGPFASIYAAQIASRVDFVDVREAVEVEMEAYGGLRRLDAFAEIPFDLARLEASSGEVRLRGSTSNLRTLKAGSLAGQVEFTVEAPGSEPEVVVTSDFREGMSYPRAVWSCAR